MMRISTTSLVFDDGNKCIITRLNKIPIAVAINKNGIDKKHNITKKLKLTDLTWAKETKKGIKVNTIIHDDWITVSTVFIMNILSSLIGHDIRKFKSVE
jgi:hypothetical protein